MRVRGSADSWIMELVQSGIGELLADRGREIHRVVRWADAGRELCDHPARHGLQLRYHRLHASGDNPHLGAFATGVNKSNDLGDRIDQIDGTTVGDRNDQCQVLLICA